MKLITTWIFSLVAVCMLYTVSVAIKRSYFLSISRMDKPKSNPKYIVLRNTKITKPTRSTTVFSTEAELKNDFPQDAKCSMTAYQNLGGGKYGKSPISIPVTVCCDIFKTDDKLMPSGMKKSNMRRDCPFKKGEVLKLEEYDINDAELPFTLPPPNDWMVELKITLANDEPIFHLKLYGHINRK